MPSKNPKSIITGKLSDCIKFDLLLIKLRKVNVHKLHFYLDNAIGCKYGTTFKVGKNCHLIISGASEEQLKPSQSSGLFYCSTFYSL